MRGFFRLKHTITRSQTLVIGSIGLDHDLLRKRSICYEDCHSGGSGLRGCGI